MLYIIEISIMSGDIRYHNRSQTLMGFQVQPVTCHDLSIFLLLDRVTFLRFL